MVGRRPTQSSRGRSRSRRTAGGQRRKKLELDTRPPHWTRRVRTWVIGVILAGLGAGIGGIVSTLVGTGASTVEKVLSPSSHLSSGKLVEDATLTRDGLTIHTTVVQGLGCLPNGNVYPDVTPGLEKGFAPGSGPTHRGKTWDKSPQAFGAVPASPVEIQIYLTGPANHAVIITDLKFHVLSRKPQLRGSWLQTTDQCGGGGYDHYGIIDFDTPPPYWLPAGALPKYYRTDILKFPYTATANDPAALVIDVQMEHCDCTWDAVLSWIDGTAAKSAVINDNGHPFETTSVTGMTGTDWHPDFQDFPGNATPKWTSGPWPPHG